MGSETVEEFLARGGTIKVIDSVPDPQGLQSLRFLPRRNGRFSNVKMQSIRKKQDLRAIHGEKVSKKTYRKLGGKDGNEKYPAHGRLRYRYGNERHDVAILVGPSGRGKITGKSK